MSARELVVKFGGEVLRSLPSSADAAAGEIGKLDKGAKASKKSFGALGAGAKTAMKLVGAAAGALGVGAIAATTLKGGWDRLTAIDNARAKLKGLGHDATSTQKIMDNAMASVKGTAFGMGDAASLAGQIVAAGIKPGKDLERVLSLVGDTATIAGTDLGEMGNVFSKVAGVGKLTGESMAQLSERGIPVLQWLSKEYGVSTEAAQKMVSQGKISFEAFSGIVEKNIGGAAKASGDTMEGAMANARAAVGRLGASFLEPIFGKGPGLFKSITEQIDKLSPAAKKAGEWVDKTATGLNGVWSILTKGDFQGAAKTFGLEEDSKVVDWLFRVRDVIVQLPGWFARAGAVVRPFAAEVGRVVLALGQGIRENVLPAVAEIGGRFRAAAAVVLPIVRQIGSTIMELWAEWGPTIMRYVGQITQIVGEWLRGMGHQFSNGVAFVKAIWDRWGSGILATSKSVFGNLVKAIGGALNVIQGVIRAASAIFRGDWSAAWEGVKQATSGALTLVKNLVQGTMKIVGSVTKAGADVVVGAWNWLRDKVDSAAGQARDWVVGKLVSLRDRAVGLFEGIGDTIGKKFDGLKEGIAKPLRSASTWLNENILSPMNNVTSKFGVTIPQIPKFHTGGMIPGSGELPIMALGGEGVLSRKGMEALGGKRVLDQLNRGVGGWLDWAKKPKEWIADLAKNGIAWGIGKIFDATSGMTDYPPPMAGELLRGAIGTMKSAALAWAKGKDDAEKAATSGPANLPGGRAWPANTRALSGNYAGHSGVDIAAAAGTPIFAAASGPITYAGWGRGYGQAIFQAIGGGLQAVYGHSSRVRVQAGQTVAAGTQIGDVGSTGRSTGPHLHFEINSPGAFGTPANRAATLRWLGFDQGGWLPPGQSMTVNNSGRPEAILTAEQWDRLLGALEALAAGGRAVVDGESLREALRDEVTRTVATHTKKVLA